MSNSRGFELELLGPQSNYEEYALRIAEWFPIRDQDFCIKISNGNLFLIGATTTCIWKSLP